MQLETGPMSSMSYRSGYKPHDAKTKHIILSQQKYQIYIKIYNIHAIANKLKHYILLSS